MVKEKRMPTVDDFCEALGKSEKTKASDQIRQSIVASKLLNPCLGLFIMLMPIIISFSVSMAKEGESHRNTEL